MDKRQDFFLSWWQASILVFLVAMAVRLMTLNQMGKTWDEPAYVETGYTYVELVKAGNFDDPFWYEKSDHPPLIRYVYGLTGILDIRSFDREGSPQYYYNYTFARIVSSIVGSLSAVFIVLIGYLYFSRFVGFASGVIFSLIPFFVGLSQLATLESFIMFFFTGSVYFYLRFLTIDKKRYAIISGIFVGLALLVKQSNIIVIPLLTVIAILHLLIERKNASKKNLLMHAKGLVLVVIFSLLSFFILWPMPFFNIRETWAVQQSMWIDAVRLPPPEVFYGRLMLVPMPYYIVMFFITTPLVLIVLSLIGVLRVGKIKNFIAIAVLIWFLFPFLQSFYAFKQHGVRYIIEIYAPFSLLCGLGLLYLSTFIKKIKHITLWLLTFVVIYLGIILVKVSPYYLDYFNELVGGNRYVYESQLFQMGWWGQGIGEAMMYIAENEKRNVTVALDGTQPMIVAPRLKNIKIVDYNTFKNADYVVVPYFNVVRLGFPEHELRSKYEVVYSVKVDSAPFVKVYKRLVAKPNFYQIP